MTTRVLVSVASKHGSTTEIGEAIGYALQDKGLGVDIVPPAVVDSLADYDAVILGSAVYLGRWLAPAQDFVIRFHDELVKRPVWLFSSGPVGDPSGHLTSSLEREDAEGIAAIGRDISPLDHHVFAGKLDPGMLALPHVSHAIFHGMSGDFRNWTEVTHWADGIATQLHTLGETITFPETAAPATDCGNGAGLR